MPANCICSSLFLYDLIISLKSLSLRPAPEAPRGDMQAAPMSALLAAPVTPSGTSLEPIEANDDWGSVVTVRSSARLDYPRLVLFAWLY